MYTNEKEIREESLFPQDENEKKKKRLKIIIPVVIIIVSIAVILCTFLIFRKDEEKEISRNINFNKDWKFKLEYESNWKSISLPHDFSISQEFDENYEAESGFLPGGIGLYQKTYKCKEQKNVKYILNFDGSYFNTTLTINDKYVGENHYGYNPFAFDITDFLTCDDSKENKIEVKVEHQIPSSRYYSGSGLYRDVKLSIIDKVHIAEHGVYVIPSVINGNKGKIKIEVEIENELDEEYEIGLNFIINDKEGKQIKSIKTNEETEISKNVVIKLTNEIELDNIKLWSDEEPYFYNLKVELLNDKDKSIDFMEERFGFRYYTFDYEHGFSLNGKLKKLNGVSMHHDHGAIGSIDNNDSIRRKWKMLQDMGMNSVRTTHNIASKNWVSISEETGMILVEESFDGWKYSKNKNVNDFGKYFEQTIGDNNKYLIGAKPEMTWAEFAIKCMIKRDRNSPAIIMWSVGNEVSTGAKIDDSYVDIIRNLIKWGKQLDSTRPYTMGDNKPLNEIFKKMEEVIHEENGVFGFNYIEPNIIKGIAEKYGNSYYSESASAINTRGIYNIYNNGEKTEDLHLTSYDNSYVSWGHAAHVSFHNVYTNDFISGQYIWTGFDYIGEPTPWNGESPGSKSGKGPIPNSAYFGIIDTAYFPKDSYYFYRSKQNTKSYTAHIVSAWDKNNMYFTEEYPTYTPVVIYSNADIVEIYRNDIEGPICNMKADYIKTNAGYEYIEYIVESNTDECKNVTATKKGLNFYGTFYIEFEEDTELYLKAFDKNGKEIEYSQITGLKKVKAPNLEKLQMVIKPDKYTINKGGESISFVEVSIEDNEGYLNTVAKNKINIKLEGNGKILGVDNGDEATIEKFQQKSVLFDEHNASIKVFAGKALIIVTSTNEVGNIKLKIESDGLETKEISIKVI